MNFEKDPLGTLKFLNIAAEVEALSMQASQEPQTSRIAGHLARNPHDLGAISEAIIDGVKRGDAVISMIIRTPIGHALLQYAMWQVSLDLWETFWNSKHPDRFGLAWEGEDFALMSVWREKVLAMFGECHQEGILALTVVEYFDHLTSAGGSEEVAEALADWISQIHGGDPPST